jgi:hypothetical protein
MSSRTHIALIACFMLSACNCEDGNTPQRKAQGASAANEPTGEARPNLPPPEGTPVEPKVLERFAPESLPGEFTADGDAQRRSSPLPNGGTLPGIRRTYRRATQKLTLDITDSLHAASLRELVIAQQGQERKTARSEFKGASVAGQPALIQFHQPTETAIVNMVVGDRYMLNIKVSPVDSAQPALAAAAGLALSDLAQVDANNPAARPAPAPTSAATQPAAAQPATQP